MGARVREASRRARERRARAACRELAVAAACVARARLARPAHVDPKCKAALTRRRRFSRSSGGGGVGCLLLPSANTDEQPSSPPPSLSAAAKQPRARARAATCGGFLVCARARVRADAHACAICVLASSPSERVILTKARHADRASVTMRSTLARARAIERSRSHVVGYRQPSSGSKLASRMPPPSLIVSDCLEAQNFMPQTDCCALHRRSREQTSGDFRLIALDDSRFAAQYLFTSASCRVGGKCEFG